VNTPPPDCRSQLCKSWAATLRPHGIVPRKLLGGKINDDRLAAVAEKAGFSELDIIEILSLFCTAPKKLPTPAVCQSRVARVTVMRKRFACGEALRHPDDSNTWEVGLVAHAGQERPDLEDGSESDYLDDVPRRLAGLPPRAGS